MATSRAKGDVVEDVVAMLYAESDATVQTRQHVPVRSNPHETREIDILVKRRWMGIEVRAAFECKNYAKKVGIAEIGAFRDKLEEVGIPTQLAFFVTTSDFTADALRRAQELGMHLLHLDGLTRERLSVEVHNAVHSIIFLWPFVSSLSVEIDAMDPGETDPISFYGTNSRYVGSVPDLIWVAWRDGMVPSDLGDHEMELVPPADWR